VDFSNFNAAVDLFTASIYSGFFVARNCQMPSSWTGTLLNESVITTPYARAEMWNCDGADTNYRTEIQDVAGALYSETTLVKTGGASDGTTTISWKIISAANAEPSTPKFYSPEIVKKNVTTGSSITVTVDILHDSATNLQDDEVWLEVMYLGTSGVPLGSYVDDAYSNILATPADQSSSAATWTTTGMSDPNTQKLSVTFTPQEVGYIHARVIVTKPSYTLYVDPELQIS
jgi:hypothetical protein